MYWQPAYWIHSIYLSKEELDFLKKKPTKRVQHF